MAERLIDTPEMQTINKACWLDSGKYARYYYPGRYNLGFDGQLDNIFETIDAKIVMPSGEAVPKYNKINIISWRGRGKTTIMKTILAKRLRYRDTMHAAYIGKSYDWAAIQTEAVRRGMIQNQRETDSFGFLKPLRLTRGMQEAFSKRGWMTNSGALVYPRGCGQPIRGNLHDWELESYRISFIGIDDLMVKPDVNSEIYREQTWDWLLTDISLAVPTPEMSMNWQIIYIDTVKHADAANVRLIDHPEWKTLIHPLATEELKSLAPTFYSDAQVKALWKNFVKLHQQDLFAQEFMCSAISKEDAVFQPHMFKYYKETDKEFQEELRVGEIENVVLADPAKTAKSTSADSAVVGVGVNKKRNKLYVRDVEHGHWSPNEFYDKVFSMAQRLRPCHVIGLEVHSLNEYIVHPFLDEMNARGLYFEVVELNPRHMPAEAADRTHGKAGRVSGLVSYYRKGVVYHNEAVCYPLEAQLLSYPYPKKWDIMDALAYIVQLLEKGLRYFENQQADAEESEEQIEREFKDLVENDYEEEDDEYSIGENDNFRISP